MDVDFKFRLSPEETVSGTNLVVLRVVLLCPC